MAVIVGLAGCWKKSGDAIVLEKEHIAVAEITPTPGESKSIATPAPTEETTRELGPNEIDVDGYVMDRAVRGTSKDPRATDHELWLVRVELVGDGRRIDVCAEPKQYEKLKPGDRVHITYRQGKYTGTVWSSEID